MKIDSYIKIPDIDLPDDFTNEPEKYFIHLDDKERILEYLDAIDERYVEGALTIKYENLEILDFELWDLIGSLWAYLLNAVEELLEHGKGECYYPDQPIKLELTSVGNGFLHLVIGEGKYGSYKIPKDTFLNTFLNEAEHFFGRFNEYFTSGHFNFHVAQIVKLKSKLNIK
ncbi:hypothetical protein D3C74_219120 [compost metagenome]